MANCLVESRFSHKGWTEIDMDELWQTTAIKHFEKAGNFLSCCRFIRGGRYSEIVCNDMTILNCFFVGNLKPLWCK